MANLVVHNVVRGRHNRTLRAQSPKHHSLKQYVGGTHRVLRGRPVVLSEADVRKYMNELKQKTKWGVFEVRTRDGRVVDLDTLAPTKELPVSPPLPHRVPDSIANDTPAGYAFPKYPGGDPATALEADKVPSLVTGAPKKEDEEEEGDDEGEEDVDLDDASETDDKE